MRNLSATKILSAILVVTICCFLTSCSSTKSTEKLLSDAMSDMSQNSLYLAYQEYNKLSDEQKEKVSNGNEFIEFIKDYDRNIISKLSQYLDEAANLVIEWNELDLTGYNFWQKSIDDYNSVSFEELCSETGISDDKLLKQLSLYITDGSDSNDPYAYNYTFLLLMAYPDSYYYMVHNYALDEYSGDVISQISAYKNKVSSIISDEAKEEVTQFEDLYNAVVALFNYLYDIDDNGITYDLTENNGIKNQELLAAIESYRG